MAKSELRSRWFDLARDSAEGALVQQIIQGPEFTGPADLRGLTFSVDHNPAVVTKAGIKPGSAINFVDFSFAVFEGAILSRSKFIGCQFEGADFKEANIIESHFEDCVFVNAQLRAFCDKAKFINCNFSDAKLIGGRGAGGNEVVFSSCNFHSAQFKRIRLHGAQFTECSFKDAIFESADLLGSNFLGAKPSEVQLANTTL